MTQLTLSHLDKQGAPDSWLVAEGDAPIGVVSGSGVVRCPSGAEYTARLARLWPADGDAVAGYNEEASSVSDFKTGVTWDLRPDWRTEALIPGVGDGRTLDITQALAHAYTLEDAESTMPVRVKLLLAWLALSGACPTDPYGNAPAHPKETKCQQLKRCPPSR